MAPWIRDRLADGLGPHEIAVFVRSEDVLPRARAAVIGAGVPFTDLSERFEPRPGTVGIGTMHLAKGLEFRAVGMACDEDIVPWLPRLEGTADEVELREAYDTERHLFYVACTRARDRLLVTSGDPSEFLSDLLG